jgi:hypothetical protein
VGCTELELASLPARFVNVFETIMEAGVLLLRALDGHEPSLRVQPRLQLVPDPWPPSILFFGSTFREWNAVRSNGVRMSGLPQQQAPASPPSLIATSPPSWPTWASSWLATPPKQVCAKHFDPMPYPSSLTRPS